MNNSTPIQYTALFVSDILKLTSLFPPKHERVFAHHSTIEFMPQNLKGIEMNRRHKIKIICRVWDEFGDALIVENNKSKNKCPHITLSCTNDTPPVYSNQLFEKENCEKEIFSEPIFIDVVEGFSDGKNVFTDFMGVFRFEGFPIVYEWYDTPGTVYENHAHQGRVSFYVIEGCVTFSGGIQRVVSTGERFDVPVGIEHSAKVGENGCQYVVGQEIEGDA